MQRTIFDTRVVNTCLRALSRGFLRATGWKVSGALPPGMHKCVLIAAPHTSNWDLPYTSMVAFSLRLHIHWMGKGSIFRWPFGPLMRWLGGIAVDRAKNNNLVAASAAAIRAAPGPLQLVVPPEGTRYERKLSGLGPVFQPTGNVDADMADIKRFYAPIKGRRATGFAAD